MNPNVAAPQTSSGNRFLWMTVAGGACLTVIVIAAIVWMDRSHRREAARQEIAKRVEQATDWIRQGNVSGAEHIEESLHQVMDAANADDRQSIEGALNKVREAKAAKLADIEKKKQAEEAMRAAAEAKKVAQAAAELLLSAQTAVQKKNLTQARALLKRYIAAGIGVEHDVAATLLKECELADSEADAAKTLQAMNDDQLSRVQAGQPFPDSRIKEKTLLEVRQATLRRCVAAVLKQRQQEKEQVAAEERRKEAALPRIQRILRDLETNDPALLDRLGHLNEDVHRPDHKADAWQAKGNWGFLGQDAMQTRFGSPDEQREVLIDSFDERTLQVVLTVHRGFRYDWLWIVVTTQGMVCNLHIEKAGWDQAARDIDSYMKHGPRPKKRGQSDVKMADNGTSGQSAPENKEASAIAKALFSAERINHSTVEASVRRAQSRASIRKMREINAYWQAHLGKALETQDRTMVLTFENVDNFLAKMDYLYKDDQFQVAASDKLQRRIAKVPPEAFEGWSKALSKATGDFVRKHEALLLLIQQDDLFPAERFDADLSQLRCQRVETVSVPAASEVAGRQSIDPAMAACQLSRFDALYDSANRFQPTVWFSVVVAAKKGN